MTAQPPIGAVHLRRVAGVVVEVIPGVGPDIEEPGPGWRRGDPDEWIRDDNRVVINRRGGKWQAWARAERHFLWDLIEKGEAVDDGRRPYLAVGAPDHVLHGVVLESGALFDVLPEPLPEPDAPDTVTP